LLLSPLNVNAGWGNRIRGTGRVRPERVHTAQVDRFSRDKATDPYQLMREGKLKEPAVKAETYGRKTHQC
jgi:hypothetical protein